MEAVSNLLGGWCKMDRDAEGRRLMAESEKRHREYCNRVTAWTPLQCPCQVNTTLVGTSATPRRFGDSYAAVVQGNSLLATVRDGVRLNRLWDTELPCVRLIEFIDFADKRYTLLAQAHSCVFRRLFLMVRAKVNKFCRDVELAHAYGWDVVGSNKQQFCRCWNQRHTFAAMLPRIRAVCAKYEQAPAMAQRLLDLLTARVCEDVARQIVALYYNNLLLQPAT